MTSKSPDTMTYRDKPCLVLLPALEENHADGSANFLGELNTRVIVAGGQFLTHKQLLAEAQKRPTFLAACRLFNSLDHANLLGIERAIHDLLPPEVAKAMCLPEGGDLFPAAPISTKRKLGFGNFLKPEQAREKGLMRAAILQLPTEITAPLKNVQYVLWWNWRARQLQPALWCRNVEEVLYALLSLSRLHVCPLCGGPFLPKHPKQEYCCMAHRERFRQQRRREKIRKEKTL